MNLLRPLRNLRLGVKLNIVLLLILGTLLMVILFIMRGSIQELILLIGRQRVLQETTIVQERFTELEEELLSNAKILAGGPDLIDMVTGKDADNLRTEVLIDAAPLNLDDITIVDETGADLVDFDQMSGDDETSLITLGLLGIDTIGSVRHEISNEGKLEFRQAAVVPLRETTGSLVGSLLVERKVDDEFLNRLNFSREDVTLILIHEGKVLAKTLTGQVDVLDPITINQAQNGQTVVADDIVDIGGTSYMIAYMPIIVGENVEGVIAVLLNINSLVMFQNRLINQTSLVFYGLGLTAMILLTLFAWRVILVPVKQLHTVARQMSRGDYASRVKVNSNDEIGRLGQAFNNMADDIQTRESKLRGLTEELRQRTQALETISETSHRLVTILDVDQLLREVVTMIQNTFDYYHVHVYLIDQNTGELVMREGTGLVGRQLKIQGHKLQPDQGIVGQVASSGGAFLAGNVNEISNFVRNPLLPNTQSELAVPLRKGKVILGVLDMQSEEVDGFGQEDLTLMQSIADQIAVAIENARLFREARVTAAEAEALNRRLTRSTWSDISEKVSATGYVFTKSGAMPVSNSQTVNADETWLPTMTEAVQQKKLAYCDDYDNGNDQQASCLSIPLVLRDEVIGVIGIERGSSFPAETSASPFSSEENNVQQVNRAWTDDELTTVRAIAEQIANALEAARLARETQRAAWRDRVVGESTASIWATDEIEEVMKAAVTQLGDRLRASEVVIRLGTESDVSPE